MTDAANNLRVTMHLESSTLAEAETALREQLRPIARAALRGAIADVLAEGLPPEAVAAVRATLAPKAVPRGTNPATPTEPVLDRSAPTESQRRVRRSPEDLAKLADKFIAYVVLHPGCKAPDLAKSLGCSIEGMRSVQAAVKATGKVMTKGTKVHTTYWPAEAKANGGPKSGLRKLAAA